MSLVCTTIPPKVVGTLELYHVSPIPLINVGKYRVFSNKKGKNHLIINNYWMRFL